MKRFVLLALVTSAGVAAEPAKQRSFELIYVAAMDVPDGADRIQMWLPYPRTNDYQDVRLVSIKAPVATKLYQEYTYRNSMLFLSTRVSELNDATALEVSMSFRVSRREHREEDFAELEDLDGWIESGASRWLRPDSLVPMDDAVRERAAAVTEEDMTVVEKAKAIFDFTVDDEEGDVLTFIGLCRAVGIPAKFHVGFVLPSSGSAAGKLTAYRGWAEFSVSGFGWVPVDTARASENLEERDYFFGAHDADRVELTMGSDINLNPKQSGQPLPFFVYPYAEIDGKPASGLGLDVRREISFKNPDLVAE